MAFFVFHFYAHGITELHEVGLCLAIQDGFYRAFLGNTAITLGPVLASIGFNGLVADRAAADDAARAHVAGFGQVSDQLAEMKRHLWSGITHTDALAVPIHPHAQMQPAMFPSAAKLIQGDRHWTESCGRFALQETEVFRQLGGNQATQ